MLDRSAGKLARSVPRGVALRNESCVLDKEREDFKKTMKQFLGAFIEECAEEMLPEKT